MTREEWATQEARIAPLRAVGYSIANIARATGLSHGTVQRRIEQWNLPAPPPPPPKARRSPRVPRKTLRVLLPEAPPDVEHALEVAQVTLLRVAPPILPEADYDDWLSIARLAALKALQSYRPDRGAKWTSWVVQNVRWALLQHLRDWSYQTRSECRQAKITGEPLRARPVSLETRGSYYGWESNPPPSLRVEADEERYLLQNAVQKAIADLPARWRFVICRTQEGYSHAEIGGQMGLTKWGVGFLASHAQQRLREALAEWA